MHYYRFNIGDYTKHTAHLDPIEDIAYRRLLDQAYMTEKPLPLDVNIVSKLIRLRGHEDEISSVLGEFFTKTSKGWINKRANVEISEYQDKSDKSRAAAKKSWESRRGRAATGGEF